MNFTKKQEKFLNQTWTGTEWCPVCNTETSFKFNPMRGEHIVCHNCVERIHPCSLCDHNCHGNCFDEIKASLLRENNM